MAVEPASELSLAAAALPAGAMAVSWLSADGPSLFFDSPALSPVLLDYSSLLLLSSTSWLLAHR